LSTHEQAAAQETGLQLGQQVPRDAKLRVGIALAFAKSSSLVMRDESNA